MDKKDYIETHFDRITQLWLSRALFFGSIIFLFVGILDYVTAYENFQLFMLYRVIIAVLLLSIAIIVRQVHSRNLLYSLAFIAITATAVTIELMILRTGGQVSSYYVGMILFAIIVTGFVPASIFLHIFSIIFIYAIYLIPIIATERIVDYHFFFTANFFMVSSFLTILFLRHLIDKRFRNELGLRFDLKESHDHLENIIKQRTSGLKAAIKTLEDEISAREMSEKSLRESETSYRTLSENIPAIVYRLWPGDNGKMQSFNNMVESMTGYRPDELMKGEICSIDPLIHNEDREHVIKTVKYAIKLKQPFQIEYRLIHKDGSIRYFLERGRPILSSDSGILYIDGVIFDISVRKIAEDEIGRSHGQLRKLASHLQNVTEEERKHIAREIHDELGQSLTVLKMDLSLLRQNFDDKNKFSERVQSMSALIDSTINSVRRISKELRPGLLDDVGLIAAIEWQIDEFRKHSDIICNIDLPACEIELDKGLATTVFRIFQEMLTNIARHANATEVRVLIEQKDGKIRLEVKDNGAGITPDKLSETMSFGLMGMHERVSFWNGELIIDGIPGKGTTVTAVIPIVINGGSNG